MNAREKLEADAAAAIDQLARLSSSTGATAANVTAAAEILRAAVAAGIFAKAEAPKGNAGPLTDAELFGVDLSAEGKAYADLKPNECMGDYPPALPWRPIADLPKEPATEREFIVWRDADRLLISWEACGNTGFWVHHGDDSIGTNDAYIRQHFTRFLELTPP